MSNYEFKMPSNDPMIFPEKDFNYKGNLAVRLIPIILGILGGFVITLVVFSINYFAHNEFETTLLFGFIPTFSFLWGFVNNWGYVLGKKFLKVNRKKIDFLVVLVVALFSFFSLHYLTYKTTYISYDSFDRRVVVVRSFVKPSNSVSLSDKISFLEYLKRITSRSTYVNSKDKSIVHRYGRKKTTILFFLQLLGIIFGAILSVFIFIPKLKFCEMCRTKYQIQVLADGLEETVFRRFKERILGSLNSSSNLREIFTEFKGNGVTSYPCGKVELKFCPKCFDSFLIFKIYTLDDKKNEIEMESETVKMENNVAREFLNQ